VFVSSGTSEIEKILCFATLVIVPLGFAVADTPTRSGRSPRLYQLLVFTQPFASLCSVVSLSVRAGTLAGVLALPWLLLTSTSGLFGAWRLLPRPTAVAEEISFDAGFLFLLVGGAWFTAARFGWDTFGFGSLIATLTAVHFHYAGFAATIIAGITGRRVYRIERKPMTYRLAVIFILAGVPMVAAGIICGQKGYFFPSFGATLALTVGIWLLAWITCTQVVPATKEAVVRMLLITSSVASALAMALACFYSGGATLKTELLTIPTMTRTHGLLQAFGFTTCGLIAWALAPASAAVHPPGIPFSRLAARVFVGPEFFSRLGLVSSQKTQPTGIVDTMDAFRRERFDPSLLPASVRDFYENTASYRLLVKPRWQTGFRTIGLILRTAGTMVGQMRFPLLPEGLHDVIASRIVGLNDSPDGRDNVRGWIRTYEATGQTMYVAAYATHSLGAYTFMNIAFPLPAGNLTSILHLAWLGGQPTEGLLLTTFQANQARQGDQGVYFANRLCAIRLPINETIQVWPTEQAPADLRHTFPEGPTVLGRHDVWIFGLRCLALDYAILRTE
jgi:hypothetical protein